MRTFFSGWILEKAGHLIPAVKAYYAALVHFPRSFCWSEHHDFVWYIAQAAVERIELILRDYPQLRWDLVDASVTIEHGYDPDVSDDVIMVNPGRFVKTPIANKIQGLTDLSRLKIIQTRGKGKVTLVQFENGHWQLRVNGQPFFVRGITYTPTEIGYGPDTDASFFNRWMFSDKNHNGKIDAAYDAWVDTNRNDQQDADEPAVGDFQLLKEMGVNTIRFFIPVSGKTVYKPELINKPLLRDLYERFGIRVIPVDLVGAYTVGSGAEWDKGTDYTDPKQRATMKELVRAEVMDLKDEPFVLMWLLGNENNMPLEYTGINATRTNAASHPKAYAQFLNEVAKMIHRLDPDHPVGVGNAELALVDSYRQYSPALDFIGINSYRGQNGFGSLWAQVKKLFDRPVLITEYGCDAYFTGKGEDEAMQEAYHEGNFRDILYEQAGGPYTGNSIGGLIFEYLDEWWKDTESGSWSTQETRPSFPFPFEDGYDQEEWLGIVGQGSGQNSPFERQPRRAYQYYKDHTF